MTQPKVRIARLEEIDPVTLYALLKLRVDVFVVEQKCSYPELDGHDVDGALHLWVSDETGVPLAYLRLLEHDDGGVRVGRVVTAPPARGRGLAGVLMDTALAVIGDRISHLDAQTQVAGFYERYGYRVAGDEYPEDGIPHVPMTRCRGIL